MKKVSDEPLAWVAIDFLCCVLLVVYTLIAPPVQQTSSIETLGQYAVVIRWNDGSNDDVDLYVRDARGNIAFFLNRDAGLMHLEHDNLGTDISGDTKNSERILLRGVVPGEYIANVHLYGKNDRGPIGVTIELWRLRGNDQLLFSRKVTLSRQGQEETAFRFDDKGRHTSDLPRSFVRSYS